MASRLFVGAPKINRGTQDLYFFLKGLWLTYIKSQIVSEQAYLVELSGIQQILKRWWNPPPQV